MMRAGHARRLAATAGAILGLVGCSTTGPGPAESAEPRWAANGWLTPGPSGEPELIGTFARREDCESAVEGWKQRQVVGNPIYGECLPIDTH